MAEKKQCRACGREIEFTKSPDGKWVPVDTVGAQTFKRNELGEFEYAGIAFVSHFKTCSDPSRFSKKGKPGGQAPTS